MVWAVFGLYFYRQLFMSDADIPFQYWINQTVTLSLLVIAFYLNSNLLVPRFLFKNHTALYFLLVIVIIVAIAFLNRWVDNAFPIYQSPEDRIYNPGLLPVQEPLRVRPPRGGSGYHFSLGDLFTIIISGLVIGISTAITALQKWQKDSQERKELEKEKVTSELSFLKAQINPHFFFNTLNNIYVLTETDPKVAGEAIHKLSKMMRYLLYDTQQGQNMLSQEIAFIKNYISLMQLRFTDAMKINFETPTNLQDMPLAPMILLPFVENAFKHGISATQQSYINIIVSQKDKLLDVTVNNSIIKDNSFSLEINSGIGLANTRRRLDLLYPGKYKLDISGADEANEYSVHLVIDMS
jgi:two-component system, LytTR family, sensor kinase